MNDTLHLGEDKMSDGCQQIIADGTAVVIHAMNGDFAAGTARRNQGADFLAETTRLSHLRAQETVSFREAGGQRMVTESGSGRTRAETNAPYQTSAQQPVA